MSEIKLSDYIAKRLKEHGVKDFFMVSGGGAMHLNDSLGNVIPYIANHHEQASAFAAEGYARVNQKLAVVNVTTGPGGLNCLNGVFGQWTDSVPVLYISGQVKYTTMMDSCKEIPLRQLGDQEVDIISCVKSLTKYAHTVTEPKEIKYHVDKAIYEATTGRKGPVWLNIPMNVQSALIDEEELLEFEVPQNTIYDLKIDEVIEALKNSKRPLIIAGHGIRLSKSESVFLEIIEKLQIPVVTTFNGADNLPSNHPLHIGRIGTIGQRAGNFALQNADLILCLGTRNNIRQISYNWENFGKNAYKIVVDIDKAELQKPLAKPDLMINADLAEFLVELEKSINGIKVDKTWLEHSQKIREKYSFKNTKEYQQEGEELNPYYVIRKITEQLNGDEIIVSANATPSICLFQAGEFKGQRIIMNSGDASMGYGLPAAIGASKQGNRVICFEGDGSIMMNIQELATVAFNKLPIKIFVINNAGYSSIRQTQRNFFNGRMTGSGSDSGVGMPDFCALAEGFGLSSVKIDSVNDLEKKIKDVLDFEGSIVCEIVVQKEYIFTPKLSSRKLDDGTMISPSLEDMFPFLDREEFESNIIK